MEKATSGTTPQNSSTCELCLDRGWIQVERDGLAGVVQCECQKRRIINAKLAEIPERFRQAAFANYVPMDALQQRALETIAGEFTGSYFLHGDYARGKTHLAMAQYVKLIQIERPCMFMTMAELMAELRRAEFACSPNSPDPDYFCVVRQRIRHTERFHLFIDDIDKFKSTDFKFEVLFDLIDTIYKRKVGLTVTSNYTLRELSTSGAVHPSIVRRLDDICKAVEV